MIYKTFNYSINHQYQFKTNHYEIIYYYFVVYSLAISSYSQDKQTKQDRDEGLMKVEELPAVVIKRIGADFSIFLIIILTKMSED
jgi:hypothetical protein